MNIKQLEYFEEIYRCKSLSKAAKNLYISQQGLSMSILRLEDELSCRLFNRGQKGVTITEEGMFLHEHAKVILEHTNICEEHFEQSKPRIKTIKIGSVFGALSEFGAELFLKFQSAHKNINISASEYPGALLDKAVENEEIELGFGIGPVDENKFNAVPIFSVPLCLVVSSKHPLAGESVITYEELNNLPLITVSDHFKSPALFLEGCRTHDSKPDVRFQVGEVIAVHRLVSQFPKYAGLSTITVAKAFPMPDMVAIPFEDPELAWSIYLITKKGAAIMPSTQVLIQYICKHAEDNNETK